MEMPQIPRNERKRQKNLNSFNILDTENNERLDRLVKLASQIAETPIALISLIDSNRQWFLSKCGMETPETSRDISFCGHAINHPDGIFEIPDALEDSRFRENPLVKEDPNIRFYAGKPLATSDGYNIGTLCVIDQQPKKLSELQRSQISVLAEEIISIIEDQKKIKELTDDVNSKSAFVASMSHELRTPLTSIIGFTDVLQDQLKDDQLDTSEAFKTLNVLKSNSEHLVGLIGDILDFSKLEAKKYLINRETFSLNKVLKQVYNTLKIQAEKYDVDFSLQQSMSAPEYVFGDKTLLKQIIINLGNNAIKFSNGESVKIHVDLSSKENFLSIDIIDTGVGMKPEEAKKVFSPFVQANKNIAKKFDGTGLGLAITREIVDLLGGEVKLIKSEKGVGTHFNVELPFVEKYEEDVLETKSSQKETVDTSLLDGKKLLIVDDVKENRYLVRHYLKDFDVDFRDAATGESAIKKFHNDFDYILLDMQLPDANGLEVYEKIKPHLKDHQRVIAFTASSTSDGIDECMKAGFHGYLTKPFSTESILKAVHSVKV